MILADLRQVAKHQKRSSRDMLPDLLSRAHWEVFNVISLTTSTFGRNLSADSCSLLSNRSWRQSRQSSPRTKQKQVL